ncbi:MAG: hypothetical protein H0X24_12300, partial [Ktedonobacterales bacterium]|nr:hypothetical protein [Ktedonobacterales bacterium]
LISTLFIDTPDNLKALRFHFMLDGKDLATRQTLITLIDPTFSQQFYGGQFDWIQNGAVIQAGALKVGNHTLRTQIFDATGLTTDTTISFQMFPRGSSTCK